jgi:hypothetical protein
VWRGIYVLNEVKDGCFDEMPVSLDYLKERYERKQAIPRNPSYDNFKRQGKLDQAVPVPLS